MVNVIMLSVIKLDVVVLSDMAPRERLPVSVIFQDKAFKAVTYYGPYSKLECKPTPKRV